MAITIESLAIGIGRAHARMSSLEPILNEADSKLGDGDTGAMLARLIGKLAEQDLEKTTDLGEAFMLLAKAAAGSTGSSLGTLLATAFVAIGRQTKGSNTALWTEISEWHALARDAMLERGKASLGDKTVIDCIDRVATALEGVAEVEQVKVVAVGAANDAVREFRVRQCRIGRARMFGDRSVGIDDPGMLAYASLCDAVCATGQPALPCA